jgi:cytoskeletal protein RodZ
MASFEKGSDDVRVFDAAEDDEDVEGSRLPLLIVIALVVLAAFAAVVWLAYQQGLRQGHAETPREIAAEPGPAKVAPANPGGTATPYTGLKIFQQPAGSEEEANADTAPADATPKPPAVTPAPKPAATPPPAAAAPTQPSTMAAVKPQPETPKPAAATPKPAPAAASPAPKAATAAPMPLAPKSAQTAAVTPKPVETAPPAPAGSGLLQIGAYKSTAEAEAAWKTYVKKHASLVGGLGHSVMQVDLGAKGTWYRLRAVAGSKAEASELCTKLKADGGDCILSK